MKKRLYIVASVLIGAFLLMQLVPYRVDNPSTRAEPQWDSPRTRALAVAACYDCHSNQSKPAWFDRIAPVSWWIANHVKEGRGALNFSEWTTNPGEDADDAAKVVAEGEMPPGYYTWLGLHGAAKLTPAERDELARGLRATIGDDHDDSDDNSGKGS
jgi:mono/diheme cytochrome c family protein